MIITKTPLRITFAGGGSDMDSYYMKYPAHCISATINKYVYVLVKKRFDDKVYLKFFLTAYLLSGYIAILINWSQIDDLIEAISILRS